MDSRADSVKQTDLLDAIIKNVGEATDLVDKIAERVMNCANLLRVEQSEKSFRSVSEEIKNLSYLMDFITEVKKGMTFLISKGYDISLEPFSCWDRSLDIFNEMLSAFQGEDWVTVSDLLQYELCPLLKEGKRSFDQITEALGNFI